MEPLEENLEYIKIRNRSRRYLRFLQRLFLPYLLAVLSIFFLMGYEPAKSIQSGIVTTVIGAMLLFTFAMFLGVLQVDLPPIINKTEECPKGPFVRN